MSCRSGSTELVVLLRLRFAGSLTEYPREVLMEGRHVRAVLSISVVKDAYEGEVVDASSAVRRPQLVESVRAIGK